jgi:SAM-dependent methyltransferase
MGARSAKDFMRSNYPESRFGGFSDIDGTMAFYMRINALIDPSFVVLDLGCGRGACGEDEIAIRRNLRILRGKASRVIGADVDGTAATNPFIDEFRLLDEDLLPFDNDSIDMIVCDNVLEHVENPERLFAEIGRILRRGGCLCVRTPNRWNYVAVLSRIIPAKRHLAVLSKAQERRKEEDVFPAYYRCNSIGKLKRLLSANGFEHAVYGYDAEPTYLSFSRIAYGCGVLHQRLAPRFMKSAIFAFARLDKNPSPGTGKGQGLPSEARRRRAQEG